jgi:hypothetical protein
MYHFRILLLSICFFSINLNAQTDYGETLKSRLYVGGTFGLSIGSISYIDLSPMVGYNINRYLSGGVGMTYMFYSERNGSESIRRNFYGGRIFTRILPLPDLLPGIFLHGELESINNERYIKKNNSTNPELARAWTPAVLVGAGFRQQAGTNSYFTVSVLYNTLDDGTEESTFYDGPLIYRVGFILGLY